MAVSNAAVFRFSRYECQWHHKRCAFYYEIEMEDGKLDEYVEILTFPTLSFDNELTAKLEPFLVALHMMLGISYWKLFCPRTIHIKNSPLSEGQAQFWNAVYTKGLGEFFYTNDIDYRGLAQFPWSPHATPQCVSLQTTEHILLPMGGGKDSILSAELVKEEKKAFDVFILNPTPLHKKVAELIGKVPIEVYRTLDSRMLDLSKKKSVYTGHVPMTAIYSFIALFVAAVRGNSVVVLSNERSANYGNVVYLGAEINHQWSKSEEFESLLQHYVQRWITPSIHISSLLRKYDEIEIVEHFVHYPQYFPYFSSCNRNFALDGSKNNEGSLWCGTCPKCAFVFSALAAYLPKETVVKIFGKNMYADKNILPLYRALLGKEKSKPFECVGTPQEEKRAFDLARQRGEYTNDPVMKMYTQISGDVV